MTESKNVSNNKHLYKDMREYGIENFSVEQIDSADDFKMLGQLERQYIKYYNSQNPQNGYNITAGGESNQWDGNPAAKLTYEDVVHIREIYSMNELKLSECWEIYKGKISYSGFQKVWEGTSWNGIMDNIYTKENISIHSHQKGHLGNQNCNSKLTEEEVLNARIYYMNHTLQETYEKYGQLYSKSGFRETLTRTFSHIPIYKKMKKQWILNNKIIDINNYKPVSTISGSGE